jgi:hypothetical protein
MVEAETQKCIVFYGYNRQITGQYNPNENTFNEILDFKEKDEQKVNYSLTVHKENDGTVNIIVIGGKNF